ncbi:hypothetical protein [Flavobacterium sp.]|uniref:hypothetical protein n=1 Tax=Flavobacterium sp. TaxID=239 RepID=UPI0012234E6D|nr:hypothetical protein [Flavobacterium sp.]RZJ73530.1 MAG: hypothetical protein EOO49_01575 [Flavobacterium sp.]
MKKMLFGMSALVLLFASCTGNDDEGSNNNGGVVLLKKTIETGPDGDVYISTATYNGTKLDKITTNDGETIEFTYTGDNITKMVYKLDGEIDQEERYTYDSQGRLATHVSLDFDFNDGSREVFTYNSDNVVSVQRFSGDLTSQTQEGDPYTITFANGEVSQIVSAFGTTTFTYDDKNSPFKNVTGYAKISYVDLGASGTMHNMLTETSSNGDDTVYTYQYNSANYPTQSTETYDGDVYVTQFQYN